VNIMDENRLFRSHVDIIDETRLFRRCEIQLSL